MMFKVMDIVNKLNVYNVIFNKIGDDCRYSMPLGNGDIAISAWVEQNGDLLFYIGKSDSWDENVRLLKISRVRVTLSPNPFIDGTTFIQTLDLHKGEIVICAENNQNEYEIRLWIDANNPIIHVCATGKIAFEMGVSLEMWRTSDRVMESSYSCESDIAFSDPFYGVVNESKDNELCMTTFRDIVESDAKDAIIWYHTNQKSCYKDSFILQDLENLVDDKKDPLLHRVFGGMIAGEGFITDNDTSLKSTTKNTQHEVIITVLTKAISSPKEWKMDITEITKTALASDNKQLLAAHHLWWDEFWSRSWLFIDGAEDTFEITRGNILQRFFVACSGRGNSPIKFNGSLFTLPQKHDPDYRCWGGGYWFQNTRLIYWPMIAYGDFDLMKPYFKMYFDMLDFAKDRTKTYFGHDGAHFCETIYFWGAQTNFDYGRNRVNETLGIPTSSFVKYYWQSGLEISNMMLEYYDYTQEEDIFKENILPFITEILKFYDCHYNKDNNGKMLIEPAASLETWPSVKNPLPEIAGLNCVISRLLKYALGEELKVLCQRVLISLPAIPLTNTDGKEYILPAQELILNKRQNSECPELYCIFPYRIYGLGKPNLQVAIDTFNKREVKSNICWRQDNIQSACLGLAKETATGIVERFKNYNEEHKFPAMWGPHFDELPDLDHGGVGQMALQFMLMQCDENEIRLFPAWPKEWNVEFKLHAPKNTTIECVYRDGELQSLVVTPQYRKDDIIIMQAQ